MQGYGLEKADAKDPKEFQTGKLDFFRSQEPDVSVANSYISR